MEEPFGNVTQIERDALGRPTAIVAPFGQRTELALDANGFLSTIENPAAEETRFVYTSDGLLKEMTDPRGATAHYSYSDLGRLQTAQDRAGGMKQLTRFTGADGYEAVIASPLGRETRYRREDLANSQRLSSTTSPAGLTTASLRSSNGTVVTEFSGMVTTSLVGADPRFGMQAPFARSPDLRQLLEEATIILDPSLEGCGEVTLLDFFNNRVRVSPLALDPNEACCTLASNCSMSLITFGPLIFCLVLCSVKVRVPPWKGNVLAVSAPIELPMIRCLAITAALTLMASESVAKCPLVLYEVRDKIARRGAGSCPVTGVSNALRGTSHSILCRANCLDRAQRPQASRFRLSTTMTESSFSCLGAVRICTRLWPRG